MIEQTVEELTPVIGTRPACRALGAAPATIYRRRTALGATASAAQDAVGQGTVCERARGRAGRAVLRALRRQLASAGLGDAARRGPLPRLKRLMCLILAAEHGGVRGAPRPAVASRLRQARAAGRAPQPALVLGHHEAARPHEAEQRPLRDPRRLQPIRRRLDRPAPRERRGRQGADRPSRPAAAGHARAVDRARRPRQLDDLKARRLPACRSRPDQDPQPAPHLHRQPLLRSAVQDAQVPAGVPATLPEHRARAHVLPRVLRLLQPLPPALRDRLDDAGDRSPRPRRVHARRPQRRARRRLRRDTPAIRPPRAHAAADTDRRVDRRANARRSRALQSERRPSHPA